jgi:hypothetical protein
VQDDAQQGSVNGKVSIIVDEAQSPKFIQEKTDAGSCRANHVGERFLIDIRQYRPRLTFPAEIREKQKQAREPFLA